MKILQVDANAPGICREKYEADRRRNFSLKFFQVHANAGSLGDGRKFYKLTRMSTESAGQTDDTERSNADEKSFQVRANTGWLDNGRKFYKSTRMPAADLTLMLQKFFRRRRFAPLFSFLIFFARRPDKIFFSFF